MALRAAPREMWTICKLHPPLEIAGRIVTGML
jgi:hypothetical protein